MLQEIGTIVAIIVGVFVVSGAVIGAVVWALLHKYDERRGALSADVLELAQTRANELEKVAQKVPELEQRLELLRGEVSGAKAVSEARALEAAEHNSIVRMVEGLEKRNNAAHDWQARYNRATLEALNRLLAIAHQTPVTVPDDGHRSS